MLNNGSMTNYLNVAVDAALAAGDYISAASNKIDQLEITQKSLHDYVSDVDRQSEQIIIKIIAEQFPDHAILGEEYGLQGGKASECQWVIDPLDGTTNFLRSIPHYAVSIAMMINGQLELGVVYDPAKKDLFCAQKGQGAFLNDAKISVSPRPSIEGALIATGIPFSGENLAEISSFSGTMESLLALQTSGVRRLGAAALDLAYVAAGRYDGFWEAKLQPWDIAAGALLVLEAGGLVSDLHGGSGFMKSGDILVGNQQVHHAMLNVTSACYAP